MCSIFISEYFIADNWWLIQNVTWIVNGGLDAIDIWVFCSIQETIALGLRGQSLGDMRVILCGVNCKSKWMTLWKNQDLPCKCHLNVDSWQSVAPPFLTISLDLPICPPSFWIFWLFLHDSSMTFPIDVALCYKRVPLEDQGPVSS